MRKLRRLSIVFGSVLLLQSAVFTAFASDETVYRYGDLNNDGRITSADVDMVSNHIKGIQSLTGNSLILADVDGDHRITSTDAAYIQRYALGMIKGFPALNATYDATKSLLTINGIARNGAGKTVTCVVKDQNGVEYFVYQSTSGSDGNFTFTTGTSELPKGIYSIKVNEVNQFPITTEVSIY